MPKTATMAEIEAIRTVLELLIIPVLLCPPRRVITAGVGDSDIEREAVWDTDGAREAETVEEGAMEAERDKDGAREAERDKDGIQEGDIEYVGVSEGKNVLQSEPCQPAKQPGMPVLSVHKPVNVLQVPCPEHMTPDEFIGHSIRSHR